MIGNASISDYGLLNLKNIPLVQLNIASFYSITDYSITSLIKDVPTLKQITLVDMPQVTGQVIKTAISICALNKQRHIVLTFSDEQINKMVEDNYWIYPPNLTIKFNNHLCGKQLADSEPTDTQLILVILISILILAMTLVTTIVVILVPLSMLLIMVHEYLIETIFTRINIIEFMLQLNWHHSFNICDNDKLYFPLFRSIFSTID